MSSFFFSGSSVSKLDDKSRFVIPQNMRFGLVEEGKLEFTIGLGLGGCLAIYRNSDIQKIVQSFRQKQHMAQYQRFFTLFFSTMHQTTCDKLGRTNVPGLLKEAVKMKKEIVVAGVMDKIEIWPKEVYDRNLRDLMDGKEGLGKLTEEAFSLLGEQVSLPSKVDLQTAAESAFSSFNSDTVLSKE